MTDHEARWRKTVAYAYPMRVWPEGAKCGVCGDPYEHGHVISYDITCEQVGTPTRRKGDRITPQIKGLRSLTPGFFDYLE